MVTSDTTSPLDNPVWSALTGGNEALAEGGPLARRFHPQVAPFAAMVERSPTAWEALKALVPRGGGRIAFQSAEPIAAPDGLVIDMQRPILQMVMRTPTHPTEGPDHVVLGAADVPEMLDLAGRTRPGPFGPRTIELGRYIGLRHEGALAAMAGERMRFDRYVEISAVCVDPAHRGKGHAALLMKRLAHALQTEGSVPILHVFADNANAIGLYEKLGFVTRSQFYMTSLRHAAERPGSGAPDQAASAP